MANSQQASFEDKDIMDLPDVTEETVADLIRDKDYIDKHEHTTKTVSAKLKAMKALIPDNPDKAIRYRVADRFVIECTPRAPREVSFTTGPSTTKKIKDAIEVTV
tara:strand:- start:60 stop:374 length:315 start_codon:yes stop_codon:yes gene_type:complete